MDLASGQVVQVAAHEAPIKSVRYCEINGAQMAVTGSWDKTIKYWDFRQQTPVGTVTCQERVYTMDVRENLLVVGTADRYINVINLADPTKFYKTIQSPLKWQTRVVSCFIDSAGFAIGSIEGRCAIQYVDDKDNAYVYEIQKPKPASWCVLTAYDTGPISHSNAIGTRPRIRPQMSMLSTTSLSTLNMERLVQPVATAHSTSGIRMPSTD